ncbi:MAG: hypothetical protein ACR2N4_15175 [Jatrophihabitans sp.]
MPAQQDEQQPAGPWNQPALRDARERQIAVRIGNVPAAAATLGQPYMRGTKKVQAVLISPLTDPAGGTAVEDSPPAVPPTAPPRPDPKLRNVQGPASRSVKAVALTQDPSYDPPPSPDSHLLFAPQDEFEPPLESPSPTGGSWSGGRRWPLLATAAAFALSIGIPVALHLSAPSSSTTAPAAANYAAAPVSDTAARQRAELLSWVGSYLPQDSVIVTDQASGDQLRTAGFTNVHTFGQLDGTSLHTVDYVIDVPSSHAQPAGQSGRTQLVATSLPLAAFGAGSTADTARELLGSATADAYRRQRSDSALRRQGGAELSQNPAIVADTASRAVLAAGQLDLRAQNVLNLLASTGAIYLTSPQPVPAEQQVGQPVRSIVITSDNLAAVQRVLASMIVPYKPDTIVPISQRKLRLSWNPAIAPVATVGQ